VCRCILLKCLRCCNLAVYDLSGNEVSLNVDGKYRINVVAHGSEMEAIGTEKLATYVTDLQFVAFLTVSLSDNCRAILIWYCELLLLKCVPLRSQS
jgi:hypothetical protein